MGSFGMMPGNNAPLPVFGGTNPTGMNAGSGGLNASFPNYPMFGTGFGTGSLITPTANQGIYGNTGIQNLSSGFGMPQGGADFGMMGELDQAYGEGMGHLIDKILNGGLFNPQVAGAYINAMQPAYNRGMASIESAFGAEGARFGSASALGLGDYSSQFALNEQQVMAQMYMQAQQEQLSLLEGILPTMHAEAASGGIFGDIMGALETVGGIAAAPFTGGMSLGLTAAGIGTLAGNNSGGGGGGFSSGGISPFQQLGFGLGSNYGTGPFNSGSNSALDWQIASEYQQQQASAGASLGGATPDPYGFGGDPYSLPFYQ